LFLSTRQGADVTRRTKKGETLRSLAMRHKNTSIVALLDKHMQPSAPVREEASKCAKYDFKINFLPRFHAKEIVVE